MEKMMAGFKEELDNKYPSGATFKQIDDFCAAHPVLCNTKEQEKFKVYIVSQANK